MILKSDLFPTEKIVTTMDINISGGPNYRRIAKSHICCVGQPTVSGVRTILNFAIGAPGFRPRQSGLQSNVSLNGLVPGYSSGTGYTSGLVGVGIGGGGSDFEPALVNTGSNVPITPQSPAPNTPSPIPNLSSTTKAVITAPPTAPTTAPSSQQVSQNAQFPVPQNLQSVSRQVSMTSVISGASGIGNDFNLLHIASSGSSNPKYSAKCVWINLREEPVVYMNNRPFVLRDFSHPFRNMQSFRGIRWNHLFEVEARLKHDIIVEASKHHNILIHDETEKYVCSLLFCLLRFVIVCVCLFDCLFVCLFLLSLFAIC